MAQRVVLAMSGGVDSSVCARVLLDQGYDVVGLFMRTGVHQAESCDIDAPSPTSKTQGCCSAIDADDAQRVADRLDIPFHALNFEEDFSRIKDYFADEYLSGRTPNPCVVCNTWLKFGKLWDTAQQLEADFIATGHYAQVRPVDGVASLFRGVDPTKDQSYFLAGIDQRILDHIMFPIGHMQKTEVRQIAEQAKLGVHTKRDSQEICFVTTDYKDFLKQHRPNSNEPRGVIVEIGLLPGDPRQRSTTVVGEHAGISQYTVGQRKGLGIARGEPRYVLGVDPATQQVTIGPRELLDQHELLATQINWLGPTFPGESLRCQAQIRYRSTPKLATISWIEPSEVPNYRQNELWDRGRDSQRCLRVIFNEPQAGVTPGQAVVFYDGDRVLGGGWIA